MEKKQSQLSINFGQFLTRLGIGMRAKLIIIFLVAKIIPLLLVTFIAWRQIVTIGAVLKEIAVNDSSYALDDSATENIERMTTDTAENVANFLYLRDDDILYLSAMEPSLESYEKFIESRKGRLIEKSGWSLSEDEEIWESDFVLKPMLEREGDSTNPENNDKSGFRYRQGDQFNYKNISLYDEITFIGLDGKEKMKVVAGDSTKTNYPMSGELKDISKKENTYVKAEDYFGKLKELEPGDIYVSDVIGAYVGSNYIGMYTPPVIEKAGEDRGYDIDYKPEAQAYAGKENPNGRRFEGIVRWATPVTNENGEITGYVSFALNHDHIMEFVDHITPMNERYTELPSAFEGNYAFIWDYKCRNICHPRHHSIVGYDPATGEPQVPWLETSIYDAWQASGIEKWTDFIKDWPVFDRQSREKKPAPTLTRQGLVGLDGRYLNNAPQCTGWMDLTEDGGSGSFYIFWSGLHKLTTAAAIPYYTGQYAPSEDNDYSKRGFGIVTIGSGLEDFTQPAADMDERLSVEVEKNLEETFGTLIVSTSIVILLVILVAIAIASSITGNITYLINGISRFREGERQFRFDAPVKDEFGTLADSFDEMADSIVDSVKTPLCITDMDHKVIYMNEPGLAFCEMTLEEIVGTSYDESSVYPLDSVYNPLYCLEQNCESEIYFVESNGRYIKGTADYFLSKTGEKLGYIVITADVTEMVREQLKIEEQRVLLDKIFSASPDLIWYMDADGRYLTVNPRYANISGKEPEMFTGRTAEEMLPKAVCESFAKHDMDAIKSDIPVYSEETIVFADGHEETLDSVRTPIFDPGGSAIVGMLGFARNVSVRVEIETKLRSTQIELKEAVIAANRANEHKGEFLARMSHEIRTPMNAIIGIVNILQRKLEENSKSFDAAFIGGHINQIETSSQHLLGLINDILDISKIEAGKIEIVEEPVNLIDLAQTVVGIIRPRCDDKNIKFITCFDEFVPSSYLSDSLRLRQVLINLLGNAVKFTPECGTVEFRVDKLSRENGRVLARFVCRDTGVGISEAKLGTIFQPFEQEDGNVAKNYGGTGLGLAISESIVKLLGGNIEVTSVVGEGSEFSFSIWLEETEDDMPVITPLSDSAGKLCGKKMLLVDDVDINRMILVSMLDDTGLEIDEAADGSIAVEMFEKSAVDEYDIILMDVQMPVMNGYDASTAIRGMDRADAAKVPIIAITANAFKEDIDKALSFGMNAHIAKPVDMDKLMAILFRYMGL